MCKAQTSCIGLGQLLLREIPFRGTGIPPNQLAPMPPLGPVADEVQAVCVWRDRAPGTGPDTGHSAGGGQGAGKGVGGCAPSMRNRTFFCIFKNMHFGIKNPDLEVQKGQVCGFQTERQRPIISSLTFFLWRFSSIFSFCVSFYVSFFCFPT